MRAWALMLVLFLGAALARADETDERLLEPGELDVLLGPIALYPDPLLAILLPAATEPADVVLAVRYLDAGGDPALVEEQRWDENVKALVSYPEVLRWLDENLAWTKAVGEAFLVQPEDVIAAIQRLRRYAHDLGNLVTTPQQTVEVDADGIDILPADAELIYAPTYPRHVVYTRPPIAGGAPFVSFRPAARVGPWLRHDWDWSGRRVVCWPRENFRPRTWWSQPRAERFKPSTTMREWCPRPRGGQMPCKFWAGRREIPKATTKSGGVTVAPSGGAAKGGIK